MTTLAAPSSVQTFEFVREHLIEATPDIVFGAILDEIGPESIKLDGSPMPLKLEPFVGGRWYRDTGNNTGHLWGHVQVIKPPTIIELRGPLMMSYAATNHVQYQLVAEGKSTRLKFKHSAIGLFTPEHCAGMEKGWTFKLARVRELAMKKTK